MGFGTLVKAPGGYRVASLIPSLCGLFTSIYINWQILDEQGETVGKPHRHIILFEKTPLKSLVRLEGTIGPSHRVPCWSQLGFIAPAMAMTRPKAKLGFCWQFITLAGFHCDALSIDLFAKAQGTLADGDMPWDTWTLTDLLDR